MTEYNLLQNDYVAQLLNIGCRCQCDEAMKYYYSSSIAHPIIMIFAYLSSKDLVTATSMMPKNMGLIRLPCSVVAQDAKIIERASAAMLVKYTYQQMETFVEDLKVAHS